MFVGCIWPVETTVSYWPIRSDGCWFKIVSWTCLSMKLYKHSAGSSSFVSHREFCCNPIGLKRCGLLKQQQCEAPVTAVRAALTAPKDLLWEHSRMSMHNGPGNVNKMLKTLKGSGSGCVLTLLSRIRSLSSGTDLMWQKPQSFVDCCGFKGNCINFVKWCLCMFNFLHFLLQIQHAYRCQQVNPFGVFRTDTDY